MLNQDLRQDEKKGGVSFWTLRESKGFFGFWSSFMLSRIFEDFYFFPLNNWYWYPTTLTRDGQYEGEYISHSYHNATSLCMKSVTIKILLSLW